MGKGKKKHVDFKKVKLKVGRKLQRPNSTKTDFKAGKLILLNQLKSSRNDDDQSSGKPADSFVKFDLNEIHQHARHHNVNVRKEALRRLLDVTVGHSRGELKKVLGQVVEICLTLCSEVESQSIRDLVVQIFRTILTKVTCNVYYRSYNWIV